MIKKLLLLKNIVKGSSEKRMLEIIIKEAGEMGSFTTGLMEGSSVPSILINSLAQMIRNILPKLLEEYYPEKDSSELVNFANNNALSILYTEIDLPELEGSGDRMSLLDNYLLMAGDDYPDEEEAIAEEYTSYPAINVDEPPASTHGPLNLMPKKKNFEDIPEYSETVSKEILIYLLDQYIREYNPLGMTEEEFEGEEDLEPSKDEIKRFLEFMNKNSGNPQR